MLYLTLLSCVLLVSSKPLLENLRNYSFEQHLSEFNLRFEDHEYQSRKAIFDVELSRIIAHNSRNSKWKENINRFCTMTSDEKNSFLGRHKSSASKVLKGSEHSLPKDLVIEPISELPAHVDWRVKGVVSTVKDQGYCGSCWAFAAAATIESHVALSSGLLFDLSVQQLTSCTPNPDHCGGSGGCLGSTAELAFDYASSSGGLYSLYQYGYESYFTQNSGCKVPTLAYNFPAAAIDGYVRLPTNNYTALMNAVAKVGPVVVNVDATTWWLYDSGVYDGCNQAVPNVNHVVVVVGYGQDSPEDGGAKYWLVRNSWSASWGEAGYMRLLRSDDDDKVCGTDVTPTDGVACAGDTEPVKVCGTCGVIYDMSYPLNARAFSADDARA